MRSVVVILGIASLSLISWSMRPVSAQDTRREPEFAVASIKPVDRNGPIFVATTVFPDGRLHIRAASLKSLVAAAYGAGLWQVTAGEPWMESELYSIEAKSPEGVRISNLGSGWTSLEDETLRTMLRALLADRFQLTIRRQSTTGTVYVMKQSGKALRLKAHPPSESKTGDAYAGVGTAGYAAGMWAVGNMSMRQLAEFASSYYLRAPVSDQTGLEGAFDYRQSEPDLEPNYTDTADSFLRMISTVGLRLDRTEGQVETLVIASAQRPSAN